ncbi:putative integral membrane protein [Herbaspirillum sp. CF444]|uniref:YeiH family protein n=1 Tax=Herbaspirillum sp. CF444 TaxID=1144319 RepID=UPI0002726E7F|nr:YeiH family protein [Herbaspirillum sp. CF444]EJL88537.1 putative integral membrane protein [Herbaspirillum sp. CF444]
MNTSPISAVAVPTPPLARFIPGLALSAALALASIEAGKNAWLQAHGFSALTVAIVLGMLIGNTAFPRIAAGCGSGVAFSKQNLLRLGIVLYGLRLTFQDISQVGISGVVIDACMLTSTFALAWFIGVKVFKLEPHAVMLIGAGSSICGAAAVMATEPVLRARSEQVTVAVSTVVVFGSAAIFLYPLLHGLNFWQGHADFGVYIGSTVHEVAQVVAAARSIDEHTANTAVIAKMVRVMMLAPFLLILSAYVQRGKSATHAGGGKASHMAGIPWFAFAFIGVVALHSLFPIPAAVTGALLDADTFLLAMAMAALGLTTHLSSVRRAGMRPLLLGGLLFAWLIAGGALVNLAIAYVLH